jgi:uncharacterized membrane protein HdeD (DUF308 family)
MLFRFGRAGVVFGWILIVAGIAYMAVGARGAYNSLPGSLPRLVVGIVGVVVGSSIVRWAKRGRPRE